MVYSSLFPTEDYKLKFRKDQNKIYLKFIERAALDGDSSGITIEDIYLSDVALGVHFKIADEISHTSVAPIKQLISRCLRMIGHEAQMLGFHLPIVGFISAKEELKLIINQWAGDQNWHRGDFVLTKMSDDKEEQIFRFIGSFVNEAESPLPGLIPMNEMILQQRLSDQQEEKIAPEYKALLLAIKKSFETQSTDSLDEWFESCLENTRLQLAQKSGDHDEG